MGNKILEKLVKNNQGWTPKALFGGGRDFIPGYGLIFSPLRLGKEILAGSLNNRYSIDCLKKGSRITLRVFEFVGIGIYNTCLFAGELFAYNSIVN